MKEEAGMKWHVVLREHYRSYTMGQMRQRIEKVGHKYPDSKHVLLWILAFGVITFFLKPREL